MIKTMFLVPEQDNDGQPFRHGSWDVLERRLVVLAGGLSVRIGVRGVWLSGDRTYHGVSREFTVSLTTWRRLPAWLSLVDWVRDTFRQEAIYVEIAGVPEILTDPSA
jgi:hypothetical protein